MNVKKTKTMVISRHTEESNLQIMVDGVPLEMVDVFKYLGTLIKDNGKTDTEIQARTNLAKAQFSAMSKTFTSKRLKMSTKIRILKCYIFSIFTYGSEAWTLSKVLEQKIEAFEMYCYRRMGNISWKDKVTNESVLKKIKCKRSLLKDVQKRKLTTVILSEETIFSQLQWKEEWKGKDLGDVLESAGSVMSKSGRACYSKKRTKSSRHFIKSLNIYFNVTGDVTAT